MFSTSVAIGCSDLVAPSDGAWLRRDGDDVIVGCYTSRQSWQLRCVDGVWTGTVGLCPQHQYHNGDQFVGSADGKILLLVAIMGVYFLHVLFYAYMFCIPYILI